MTGVREEWAKLVKVSSRRQSSEGPKGMSTLLGPASSFSTIKEGAHIAFTWKAAKAGLNSTAQAPPLTLNVTVFTHPRLTVGRLAITLLASPGQSSLRVYLQRPSMLPFWHFHT